MNQKNRTDSQKSNGGFSFGPSPMSSMTQTLQKIIQDNDFLEDALYNGYLNLTSFATYIQPTVEKMIGKKTSVASLTMTLSRLSKREQKRKYVRLRPDDIRVRTDVCMTGFFKSPEVEAEIHSIEESHTHSMFSIIEGSRELLVVYSSSYLPGVSAISQKYESQAHLTGLGMLTIHIKPESIDEIGVTYYVVKQLNFFGINIIEIYTTLTEITILLKKENVSRAMEVLV